MKSASSNSLKSNGSHKSSSSRRSKVTFTELNPEIYVIPPKSPPKPKRSKGPTRSPVTAEEEMDLIMAMRGDEADQSAFQFELGQHAEVVSLEDMGRNTEKPYNGQMEKIYDQVPDREDTPEDVQQLLEAVQGVHQAVSQHSGKDQQPPLPPYPDLGNLSLQEENMARVSSRGSAPLNHAPSSSDPPVFSDDDLSEIFQIDFGQIFGNPEAGLKSSYKGIQSKKGVSRSNSSSRAAEQTSSSAPTFNPLPPPEQFQSSPAQARRQLAQSQSSSAVTLADNGTAKKSQSSSAAAHQAASSSSVQQSHSFSRQQSFSTQQSFSSQQSSSFQTSNVTTAHKQVVESPAPTPAPIVSEPPAKISTS